MRSVAQKLTVLLLVVAGRVLLDPAMMAAGPLPQQRSSTASPRRQSFDVVSVRRNMTNDVGSNIIDRPDGGFTMLNVPATALLARAYAPALAADMINLPRWAMVERYDITVTSASPNPTAAQRKEMLQAMLADRFKLAVHPEARQQPSYDLVPARTDRHLGPDIKPATIDCDAKPAPARPAPSPTTAGRGGPARGSLAATAESSCLLLVNAGSVVGDTTMGRLAEMLSPSAGRPIVDKTGLKGSYHIAMMPESSASAPASPDTPLILSALESRLGLKLMSSTTKADVLVVDRIERPAGN